MPFSRLDESAKTRRSAEVNEGPELGGGRVDLNVQMWVDLSVTNRTSHLRRGLAATRQSLPLHAKSLLPESGNRAHALHGMNVPVS